MERDSTNRKFIKQSISFPPQQFAWLKAEAERQEHGNVSRIVQEALREYRVQQTAQRISQSRELQEVA